MTTYTLIEYSMGPAVTEPVVGQQYKFKEVTTWGAPMVIILAVQGPYVALRTPYHCVDPAAKKYVRSEIMVLKKSETDVGKWDRVIAWNPKKGERT